jgi:CheY-like chemotaxis protein
MRICIIDDNTLLAEALSFGLTDRGHEVALAKSGEEGLAVLAARHHDVALVDWQMPGMRGDQVAERIHAQHPDVPIILMSGGSARDDIAAIQSADATVAHFIEKPFTPTQLLDVIGRITGK